MRVLRLDQALALEDLIKHRGQLPEAGAPASIADSLLSLPTAEVDPPGPGLQPRHDRDGGGIRRRLAVVPRPRGRQFLRDHRTRAVRLRQPSATGLDDDRRGRGRDGAAGDSAAAPAFGGAGAGPVPRLPAQRRTEAADGGTRPAGETAHQRRPPPHPGLDAARRLPASPAETPQPAASTPPSPKWARATTAPSGNWRRSPRPRPATRWSATCCRRRNGRAANGPRCRRARGGGCSCPWRSSACCLRPACCCVSANAWGAAAVAVAAVGRVCLAPAGAARGLCRGRTPGRGAQRLVVAVVALRRDRQAAGVAAGALADRPSLAAPPRLWLDTAGARSPPLRYPPEAAPCAGSCRESEADAL